MTVRKKKTARSTTIFVIDAEIYLGQKPKLSGDKPDLFGPIEDGKNSSGSEETESAVSLKGENTTGARNAWYRDE